MRVLYNILDRGKLVNFLKNIYIKKGQPFKYHFIKN